MQLLRTILFEINIFFENYSDFLLDLIFDSLSLAFVDLNSVAAYNDTFVFLLVEVAKPIVSPPLAGS